MKIGQSELDGLELPINKQLKLYMLFTMQKNNTPRKLFMTIHLLVLGSFFLSFLIAPINAMKRTMILTQNQQYSTIITDNKPTGFTDLPVELFMIIQSHLDIQDFSSLLRTAKSGNYEYYRSESPTVGLYQKIIVNPIGLHIKGIFPGFMYSLVNDANTLTAEKFHHIVNNQLNNWQKKAHNDTIKCFDLSENLKGKLPDQHIMQKIYKGEYPLATTRNTTVGFHYGIIHAYDILKFNKKLSPNNAIRVLYNLATCMIEVPQDKTLRLQLTIQQINRLNHFFSLFPDKINYPIEKSKPNNSDSDIVYKNILEIFYCNKNFIGIEYLLHNSYCIPILHTKKNLDNTTIAIRSWDNFHSATIYKLLYPDTIANLDLMKNLSFYAKYLGEDRLDLSGNNPLHELLALHPLPAQTEDTSWFDAMFGEPSGTMPQLTAQQKKEVTHQEARLFRQIQIQESNKTCIINSCPYQAMQKKQNIIGYR